MATVAGTDVLRHRHAGGSALRPGYKSHAEHFLASVAQAAGSWRVPGRARTVAIAGVVLTGLTVALLVALPSRPQQLVHLRGPADAGGALSSIAMQTYEASAGQAKDAASIWSGVGSFFNSWFGSSDYYTDSGRGDYDVFSASGLTAEYEPAEPDGVSVNEGGNNKGAGDSTEVADPADGAPVLLPMPQSVQRGNDTLEVSRSLKFSVTGLGNQSQIVLQAFRRYRRLIFLHPPRTKGSRRQQEQLAGVVTRALVLVDSSDERLQLNTSENYTLAIPLAGGTAYIQAPTVYGALRGLETFSQLCTWSSKSKSVVVRDAPWEIEDWPRFNYRGLLIDSARHYWPLPVLKKVLDSMSYNKLNVMHWHMVDWQSFPVQFASLPRLWQGSWTPEERYVIEDIKEIVKYAQYRGIHVMPELDVPGHTVAWGFGYPELWPAPDCREPLDVSKESTFEFIDTMLGDLRSIFPFELFHLGGDEVNTGCWVNTPHIAEWLAEHNMTDQDAYLWFVERAQAIAISHNWRPVIWEEPFDAFAARINHMSIIHDWLGHGARQQAASAGYNSLRSEGLYLDWLNNDWRAMYSKADANYDINEPPEHDTVLGAEACMWAESVDTGNLFATLYPRLSAAAEVMWRSRADTIGGQFAFAPRLLGFKCLLQTRGIEAAPVENPLARQGPQGAGTCYAQ